jgi:ribosomal protein S18 acetylase RimI-like enzyme
MVNALDVADPAVAAELVTLQRSAYAVEAELIGSRDIPQLYETVEELQRSGERWAGIVRDTRIVAAVAWELEGDTLDIARLVVAPSHARQGIGEWLVRWALDAVPHERATVSTGSANVPALRLYKKLGFAEIERVEVAPGLMVTRLARRQW